MATHPPVADQFTDNPYQPPIIAEVVPQKPRRTTREVNWVLFFGIVGPVLYGLIYSGFRLYFENPMRKTFSLWIWEMAVIAATAAILRRIT